MTYNLLYMELIQNIVEYYDELYPVTDAQKSFYDELMDCYDEPVKILRIGCGTGMLENYLAEKGADVTGLETFREVLDSANRRKRNQLMSIRYFQMSSLEMIRFLGRRFYNVVSCLDDRIEFIHDRILMRKFFFDCRELLTNKGKLVIQLYNYDYFTTEPVAELPESSSIRARLLTKIITKEDGNKYMQQDVETGNGKILPVLKDIPIYPLRKAEIIDFSNEAGFSRCEFYSSFDGNEFTIKSPVMIAVIS
jgi:2-polyprenyl-3-methyl-5-hydroxy-6-metoxy-1,4-benzoquinol methylase